ncbi:MAG: class I SAM-dependent methyltransferase [Verrucomicrobiota bacterium]
MKLFKSGADERIDVLINTDHFQNYLHWQRYKHVLEKINSKSSMLELGAGLGVFSNMVKPKVSFYRGIEYNKAACKEAQIRIGSDKLIKEGDAQNMKFPDSSFDEIVCLEVIEHLPHYRKALDEVARVLKKGGKFYVSIPYRRSGAPSKVNPHHLYEPGEYEFLQALRLKFDKIDIFYQRYEETPIMTFARIFHLRRVLGLVEPYKRLTEGHEQELKKVFLDSKRSGLLLGLFCECIL